MMGVRGPARVSTLRWRLCSQEHALRVARRMAADGEQVMVVRGREPLQPWLVVEQTAAGLEGAVACA